MSCLKNKDNVFYHNLGTEYFNITSFSIKKQHFLRKRRKSVFGASSPFWREGGVWRQKWIKSFLWEMRFCIFLRLKIFSKKQYFPRKWWKIFFGKWLFFRWGHFPPKMNISMASTRAVQKFFLGNTEINHQGENVQEVCTTTL